MNLQDYISSGVLELYAMGALSGAEKSEVESMLQTYPELKKELEDIESNLEQLAMSGAVKPTAGLLGKIKTEIEDSREGPQISTKPARGFNPMRIAASVALLVSVGLNFYFISSNNKLKQENTRLAAEQTLLAQSNQVLHRENETNNSLIQEFSSASANKIALAGTEKYPDFTAQVIWNEQTQHTYLYSQQLPKLASSQQYQLWALVNGKPVDLGVFDSTNQILNLKSLKDKPEAFAVTIEPAGGKPSPTLEQMCLFGAVKS